MESCILKLLECITSNPIMQIVILCIGVLSLAFFVIDLVAICIIFREVFKKSKEDSGLF